MEKKPIAHPEVFQPPAPYSVGIKSAGGQTMLHLAGQVALDGRGQLVGKGDVQAQTRQVFANLRNLLSAEGASMKNVVKMTTFLTDAGHLPAFMAARKEYLREEDIYPANTLVVVQALANPDWLVEIEATAVV